MLKILILGGGFGGVRAALDLAKRFKSRQDISIALLDKNGYQTFQPALYEVASIYGVDHEHPYHTKIRGTVCIPFKEIFKGTGIELIQAEVNHIDLEAKRVVTYNGETITFDYLVLALGAAASTFGVPGAEEYALKFKTIEDGLMLADKIEELYLEAGKKNRPLPINILIGGAGFNGVELAAELSNCTAHIAHKHGVTAQNCTSINLIESGPVILPMISEKERALIQKRLKKLGINISTNSVVEEVGPDYIKLKDGRLLKGDAIVWSAGLRALDLFKSVVGLELDDRGRILVNDFLQVKNYSYVFAAGDNIIFSDSAKQKPVPQLAYVAIGQGKVAAGNIAALIGGDSRLKKYKPKYNSWIAPLGGKFAVAQIGGGIAIGGFMGWLVREAVDLRYFLAIMPFFKAIELFFEDVGVFTRND